VRESRVRFWDKGTPNGDWTDVAKVTREPVGERHCGCIGNRM